MKHLLLLLALVFTTLTATTQAETISTLRGKKYLGCKVVRVHPDGISFTHNSGAAKILFTDLPSSMRSKYGYSPRKAAEYTRKLADARKAAAEKRRIAEEKASKEAEAAEFEAFMNEHRENMRLFAEAQQRAQAQMQAQGAAWPVGNLTAVTAYPNVFIPELPPIHGPVVDGKDVVKHRHGWDNIGINPLVYGSSGYYVPPSGGYAFYPPVWPALGYARPGYGISYGVQGQVGLGGGVQLGVGVRGRVTGRFGR